LFDKMKLGFLKEEFEKIISKFNASEGIFLASGAVGMIVGVLVDIFVIRIICLFVVAGSALLTYASLRAKHLKMQPALRSGQSHFPSQSESDMMKKLIFDDFQQEAKVGYTSEETEESAPGAVTSPESTVNKALTTYARTGPEKEIRAPEFRLSDFFDVGSEIYKGDAEPRTEFDFLLNKVLTLVKEVLFANSVVFFWANREKQQMVMEARVSESPVFFTARRFAIGHDLVSKVALSGKPEFVTEVNPLSESELLPYYDSQSGVRSFVGVPVFFPKTTGDTSMDQPVAVIAVDSRGEDEFGPETLTLMGQFTKLLSALIKSYNDKYDLLLDSELLSSIRRFQERVRNSFSLPVIIQSLAEEASKLVNWDFLSVVLYDETRHVWAARKVTNRAHEGYILPEQTIDFPDSIVGQAIRNNVHTEADDIATSSLPRYYQGETLTPAGSFLAIPMSSLNKCYGALALESREKYNFSRQDIDMLYRLADHAASALEIYYMQEIINEYVIIDDLTGTYSKKFFLERMEEELTRADDSGSELSLLFLTVDKSGEIIQRFGVESFERVMLTLTKAIRASVRTYDIVGRQDANRFGVLLVNTAANEAYLWAEKIRKTIAGLLINIEGKSFSITISAGVCGALEGMKKEELLGNATTVLGAASQAGGNVVRVF
jgi:diguanylate cyclase (GGDEF)-like protein